VSSLLQARILESMAEGVNVSDESGTILYVNPAQEAMFGYAPGELLGRHVSIFSGEPPQAQARIFAEVVSQLMTVGSWSGEFTNRKKDGTLFTTHARITALQSPGTKQWVCVEEDITARKRAEAERDRLLQRLQLQIERMPLGYLLFDADFRLTDWNPAAERIFGYAKEEVLGMGPPFEKILPSALWPLGEEILGRIRRGDMSAHSINENLTREGRTITCEWFNTPFIGEDGRFAGLLCLTQDITERKSLEEQYRQAQKMEAIGQLAGGVAHDFNNLITIISGYAELIHGRLPAAGPLRDLVEEIIRASERGASLTRQLLAFSRKAVLAPQLLDLNAVVVDLEKLLRRALGEDISLTVALQPELGHIQADPGQIEQVLLNLAVNARDAMPAGGKLTIETRNVELDGAYVRTHPEARPGSNVLLAVSDTGHGMTADIKARIFEPFFTTKEAGKGTGLGLSTVYGIVKQAGGVIDVASEVGVGSTFLVYLPRFEETETPQSPQGAVPSPRGTETVLLVEDEDALRALARLVLAKSGYAVLEANNGREALRVANGHPGPIALLVSDVVMPELGGRQLAERLGRQRPQMKVLFLSGYTDDAVVRHGLMQKKVNFLQKPFSATALAQKVREVLDGP
jgi:PAS domain S-box-containing protein